MKNFFIFLSICLPLISFSQSGIFTYEGSSVTNDTVVVSTNDLNEPLRASFKMINMEMGQNSFILQRNKILSTIEEMYSSDELEFNTLGFAPQFADEWSLPYGFDIPGNGGEFIVDDYFVVGDMYPISGKLLMKYLLIDEADGAVQDSFYIKFLWNDPLTSIEEQVGQNETVDVYPNPASGSVQVSTKNSGASHFNIVDVNGRIKLSKICDPVQGLTKFNVDHLENGIYFLIFYNKNKLLQSKKLVVKH